MSIRTKLLLLTLGLALGPLTIVGVIAYGSGRRAVETSLGQLFELKAARTMEALDREAAERAALVESWTALDLMQDVLDDDLEGRISAFLIAQGRQRPQLVRALVANPGGRIVAASRPDWIGDGAPGAAVPLPRAEACGDDLDADGATPLLTCTHLVRAHFDAETVLGTLVVSWSLREAFERLQRERSLESPPGGLIVLKRNGSVVSAPVGILHDNLLQGGSRAAALAISGRSGFLVERLGDEGYLIGYGHSTGPSGWSALVVQDVGAAFAPARRLRSVVLGLGAALFVATTLLSVVLARKAVRPLHQLTELAARVADGDLDPPDSRVETDSGDEIGSLARSFDTMVRRLREQRAQLVEKDYVDRIIAGMAGGLMVVDQEDRVETANDALLRLLGRAEGEVLGTPASRLFAEGAPSFRQAVLEPARRGESIHEKELTLLAASRPAVPVLLSAGSLGGREGALPAVVCIVADITARKLAERTLVEARAAAEAAALSRARFVATVSHEIRTPLNGVIGATELIAATPLGPRERELARAARLSAEALLAIVNDVLDYSRMDAGRLELDRREFDPRDCLQEVGEILAPRAQEKGLELELFADPVLPARVRGDPARLRQVLLNLGGNAVKFTDQGAVTIRAALGETPSRLLFSVEDTGTGIPAEARDGIFQPFSQLDASSTRRHGGAGLGLAIARQIVELMGGEIGVRGEEGRGATFWFTAELPRVEGEGALDEPSVSLEGLRVLVVDDNATNRLVAREMLLGWRCSTAEAADAWEALELLRGEQAGPRPFQLALVDYQMPEMDGGQLAREIRADAALGDLPLVLVTSVPQQGEASAMAHLGFDACVTKPVRGSILRAAIAAALRARGRPAPAAPPLTLVPRPGRR